MNPQYESSQGTRGNVTFQNRSNIFNVTNAKNMDIFIQKTNLIFNAITIKSMIIMVENVVLKH